MLSSHLMVPELYLENVHLKLNSSAGNIHILRGINLKIYSGETVSIIGASGSGKTSLLMVVAGLEHITQGEIKVHGKSLAGLTEDQLARLRRNDLGIVFQNFHLVPTMTAIENIALPLEFSRHDQPFVTAQKHLESVGLKARANHFPSQLSGGEQQRVAIARAFATRPRLLLADEPTGSLDQNTGREIIDLLFKLQTQHNTTMVFVTHSPEVAARCKRVIQLSDGRVLASDA